MIALKSTHYPDNLRGEGLDMVVLDEAAYMHPSLWEEVVRPMLLETQGRAVFLSTPNGRNWFWQVYQLGEDPNEPAWESFNFPSVMNPIIFPDDIKIIEKSTPERTFRTEYLAEFLDDAGQVFRGFRGIATAPFSQRPIEGHRYVAGVDWGRENDYTVIVIIDTDTRQMVAMDRFNQIGWHLQRGRLKALCDVWQPSVIYAEANSIGSVNIEELQREGLPVRGYTTTAHNKNALIESLALAIERAEISLLNDEVLMNELTNFSIERLPSGGYRYSAPAGLHDDTVIALALAWHGTIYSGWSIDFA